jgi:hypothetical protein
MHGYVPLRRLHPALHFDPGLQGATADEVIQWAQRTGPAYAGVAAVRPPETRRPNRLLAGFLRVGRGRLQGPRAMQKPTRRGASQEAAPHPIPLEPAPR